MRYLFSDMNRVTKVAICAALAGILIFSVGFFSGLTSNITASLNPDAVSDATGSVPESTAAPAPTQAPTETQPQATEATQTTEAQPQGDVTEATQAPAENSGSLSTPAEIVAYFNKSANKVKTDAVKVTRNWEDLHADNEYLEVPSALQAIGKTLMTTFLKKDETPLVWSTKDDIIANFPVKGQTFVSNTTEADIAEATCEDDGTYYNIKLKYKECTDPTGTGCDSAFNIMRADDVYEAASMVQNFSVKYYDAVIECKIDKATGNMVSATYTLPMIMQVTAKVIVSIDAQVGMTFIDDYTIEY